MQTEFKHVLEKNKKRIGFLWIQQILSLKISSLELKITRFRTLIFEAHSVEPEIVLLNIIYIQFFKFVFWIKFWIKIKIASLKKYDFATIYVSPAYNWYEIMKNISDLKSNKVDPYNIFSLLDDL